ncbi:uncharacterized protein LOC127108238 [Lathyrus oleraceus]|nr:uncharacterized protein LOC127108238 [Pisum sativum]XP_050901628.1 uncharacterized protein LOC127108238 [Pisum sativum]
MASAINLPVLSLCKPPKFIISSTRFSQRDYQLSSVRTSIESKSYRKRSVTVSVLPLGVDPWAPSIDSQSIASQLFAFSLFPYIGFLYFLTKSKTSPNLTLFGFYFLLAFVGATIPAGIYAKVHYGTSLSNVDWLHGGAESLLTLTNLFIVLGLRDGIRKAGNSEENMPTPDPGLNEEK